VLGSFAWEVLESVPPKYRGLSCVREMQDLRLPRPPT
jgi:hypothetical protein